MTSPASTVKLSGFGGTRFPGQNTRLTVFVPEDV